MTVLASDHAVLAYWVVTSGKAVADVSVFTDHTDYVCVGPKSQSSIGPSPPARNFNTPIC